MIVESGHERYAFEEVNKHGSPLAMPPLDQEWQSAPAPIDPPSPPPVRLRSFAPTINHELDQALRRLRQGADNPDDVPVPPPLAPEGDPGHGPPLVPEGAVANDDLSVVSEMDQAPVPAVPLDTDLDEPISLDDPVPSPNREPPDPGPRGGRPTRVRRPNSRVFGPEWAHTSERPPSFGSPDRRKVRVHGLNEQYLQSMNWYLAVDALRTSNLRQLWSLTDVDPDHHTVEWMSPMIFGAKANDADTPNWTEAMHGPHADEFAKAMEKEVSTLEACKPGMLFPASHG
jgi:hypothetical protein